MLMKLIMTATKTNRANAKAAEIYYSKTSNEYIIDAPVDLEYASSAISAVVYLYRCGYENFNYVKENIDDFESFKESIDGLLDDLAEIRK